MTDDESAIRELGARIDDLETAVRDLRHTVSELGRRLAMDLPQVLARHRDAIVDALAPTAPATTIRGSPPPSEPVEPTAHTDIAEPPPVDPERPPELDELDDDHGGGSARSRRSIRRRRGTVF